MVGETIVWSIGIFIMLTPHSHLKNIYQKIIGDIDDLELNISWSQIFYREKKTRQII